MYYLRVKVPYELRSIVGKTEIRKSLRTSVLKEALPKLRVESLAADHALAQAEEKRTGRDVQSPELSEDLVAWLTSKYFVQLEQKRALLEGEAEKWTRTERQEVADIRKDDVMAMGGNPALDDDREHTGFLDQFLATELPELALKKEGPDYQRLLTMFRDALIESETRLIHRLEKKNPPRNEFGTLDAHTVIPPRPATTSMTFGKFLDEYMEYQAKTHANTTPSAYGLPVRILRETIGETKFVHEVSKQDVERACELMRKTPFNVTQRYKGLSIVHAIDAANRAKDDRIIAPRTMANYFMLITAIFNYAEEEQFIPRGFNPTKSRKLREMFRLEKKPTKRALFTDPELQAMFNAPIYRGCVDDAWHFNQPGEQLFKRGRFWVPLIGLFQGLRCNEACQLYTEDIGEEDGVLYLDVREDLDQGGKALDKSVKNSSSWRRVPVHPELIKIGFREFVEARRRDASSPRLFPELKIGKSKNRYSHSFSKWFGRFATLSCGHKPAATFHSFRHHFRSAMKRVGISIEDAEALGGWKSKGSSEYEYRHNKMSELFEALSRINYPQLDFSHLHEPDSDQ